MMQPAGTDRAFRPDWDRLYKAGWALIAAGVLVWGVSVLARRLWPVLLAGGIGTTVVFLLRPVVEWLVKRRVPRLVAVLIAYAGAALLGVGIVVLLTPVVASQIGELGQRLPESVARVSAVIDRLEAGYAGLELPLWVADLAESAAQETLSQASGLLSAAPSLLLSVGTNTFGLFTGLLTGFVVGFYILASSRSVGTGMLQAMPPGWRRDLWEAGKRVEEVVGDFIRGQLLIATAVGVLTWAGMALIGMPFAALVGLIAGVTEVVPYLGPILAALIAGTIGLLIDPSLALWAVLVIFVVQQIESAVLQPKILGGQVGLHPAVVILSIIAATTLFGFAGLLLAIPITGTFKALYGFFAEKHGWQPW